MKNQVVMSIVLGALSLAAASDARTWARTGALAGRARRFLRLRRLVLSVSCNSLPSQNGTRWQRYC
jgi:hypothetical protein